MLNFHFATELFSRPFRRRLHFDKFFFCIFSCVWGFFFFFLLQPNINVTLATDKNWNEKSSREGNAKKLSKRRETFFSRNFLFLGRLQTNYRRSSIQSTKRETQLVGGCRLTPTLSTVGARLKLPTPLHVQRVAKGKSDWKGLEEESAGERSLYRRWPAKLTASRSPSISMTTFTQLCRTERRIAWFAPHFAPNPNKLCCSFCCRRWNSNKYQNVISPAAPWIPLPEAAMVSEWLAARSEWLARKKNWISNCAAKSVADRGSVYGSRVIENASLGASRNSPEKRSKATIDFQLFIKLIPTAEMAEKLMMPVNGRPALIIKRPRYGAT